MLCCNNNTKLPMGPPGPPGPPGASGGFAIIDKTWLEMNTLVSSNTLIEGFYRITDYQTTGNIPNAADAVLGAIEPLIVFALDSGNLYHQAWSETYPQDILFYELNDTSTQGAVVGRIYYRKDTIKNLSAPYDWRVWVFRRWEDPLNVGVFNQITEPNPGDPYQDFYTFADLSNGGSCSDIEIKPISKGDMALNAAPSDELNNIIIGIDSFNNVFESNWDMTCANNFINNTLKQSVSNIDFLSATHVYQPYHCDVFLNGAGAQRLSYFDNTSALNVVLADS